MAEKSNGNEPDNRRISEGAIEKKSSDYLETNDAKSSGSGQGVTDDPNKGAF